MQLRQGWHTCWQPDQSKDQSAGNSLQVMVAELSSRRKGIAAEALQLMMAYAIRSHSASGFTAKILTDNGASRALFERQGFRVVKEVACFSEMHYELSERLSPEHWSRVVSGADDLESMMKVRATAL